MILALLLTSALGAGTIGVIYFRAYYRLRHSMQQQLATNVPPSTTWIQRLEDAFAATMLGEAAAKYLARAGLPLSPFKYSVILTVATVLFVWLGLDFLQIGWPGSLSVASLLISFLTQYYVRRRRQLFLRRLQEQIPEMALTMCNALRAGQSIQQALTFAANNMAEPAGRIFQRPVQEIRLQRPMEESLLALVERHDSPDLRVMISVMLLQKKTGGNLIDALSAIAHTTQRREQTLGEVQATLAQAEQTIRVLPYIPFLCAIMFNVAVSGFLKPLFTTVPGLIIMGVMLLSQWLIAFVTRQFVRIDL